MSDVHFRRPPVPSTLSLIDGAPLTQLETGMRAVVEVVGYPDGQIRITTSQVEGAPRARRIVQKGFLMFIDADEAKDALDLLVDRVAAVAASASSGM